MPLFDDAEIRRLKQEKEQVESSAARQAADYERGKREALQTLTQGLREFPQAARRIGLVPRQYPVQSRGFFGGEKTTYVSGWPIFEYTSDSGGTTYWLPTQPTEDDIADFIRRFAYLTGANADRIRRILSEALKGTPHSG